MNLRLMQHYLMLTTNVSKGYKVDVPNSVFVLQRTPYLSGIWLGVNLRTDTNETCVKKRMDYVLRTC